jgi:hypothetical protein
LTLQPTLTRKRHRKQGHGRAVRARLCTNPLDRHVKVNMCAQTKLPTAPRQRVWSELSLCTWGTQVPSSSQILPRRPRYTPSTSSTAGNAHNMHVVASMGGGGSGGKKGKRAMSLTTARETTTHHYEQPSQQCPAQQSQGGISRHCDQRSLIAVATPFA